MERDVNYLVFPRTHILSGNLSHQWQQWCTTRSICMSAFQNQDITNLTRCVITTVLDKGSHERTEVLPWDVLYSICKYKFSIQAKLYLNWSLLLLFYLFFFNIGTSHQQWNYKNHQNIANLELKKLAIPTFSNAISD